MNASAAVLTREAPVTMRWRIIRTAAAGLEEEAVEMGQASHRWQGCVTIWALVFVGLEGVACAATQSQRRCWRRSVLPTASTQQSTMLHVDIVAQGLSRSLLAPSLSAAW